MCQSMVNIQSPTAEIRRGKKRKIDRNHRMKIYMVSLLHRATIKEYFNNCVTRGSVIAEGHVARYVS